MSKLKFIATLFISFAMFCTGAFAVPSVRQLGNIAQKQMESKAAEKSSTNSIPLPIKTRVATPIITKTTSSSKPSKVKTVSTDSNRLPNIKPNSYNNSGNTNTNTNTNTTPTTVTPKNQTVTYLSELNTSIQNLNNSVENKTSQLESQIATTKTDLEGQIETAVSDKATTSQLAGAKTELEGTIASTKSNLEGQIETAVSDKATTSQLAGAKTELEGTIASTKTALEGTIASTKSNLEGQIETAVSDKATTSQLAGAKTELEGTIASTKNDLQTEINKKANQLLVDSIVSVFDKDSDNNLTNVKVDYIPASIPTSKIANLDTKITDLETIKETLNDSENGFAKVKEKAFGAVQSTTKVETIINKFNNSGEYSYEDLSNKPTLFSGSYKDLTDKPSIPSADSFVENTEKVKAIIDNFNDSGEYSYEDLSNKPTLFSGSYKDLTDKPTIPSKVSELTNDENYITSTDKKLQYLDSDGKFDVTNLKGTIGNSNLSSCKTTTYNYTNGAPAFTATLPEGFDNPNNYTSASNTRGYVVETTEDPCDKTFVTTLRQIEDSCGATYAVSQKTGGSYSIHECLHQNGETNASGLVLTTPYYWVESVTSTSNIAVQMSQAASTAASAAQTANSASAAAELAQTTAGTVAGYFTKGEDDQVYLDTSHLSNVPSSAIAFNQTQNSVFDNFATVQGTANSAAATANAVSQAVNGVDCSAVDGPCTASAGLLQQFNAVVQAFSSIHMLNLDCTGGSCTATATATPSNNPSS